MRRAPAEPAAGAESVAAGEAAPGARPDGELALVSTGAECTRGIARRIARHLRGGDLVVLDGPLGAGKTTFTQGLGDGMGVRGPVASPTFVISRVHPSLSAGPALVHVDAYRLGGAFDIEDLDLDAELEDAVTVAEWGRERVEHLTDSHLLVILRRAEGGQSPDASAADATGEDATGADATGEDADDLDETRTIRVLARGPRWDAAATAALAADLADGTIPATGTAPAIGTAPATGTAEGRP